MQDTFKSYCSINLLDWVQSVINKGVTKIKGFVIIYSGFIHIVHLKLTSILWFQT